MKGQSLLLWLLLYIPVGLWGQMLPCGHNVEIPSPLILCSGDSLLLDVRDQGFPEVEWYDEHFNLLDTGQTFAVTSPGNYQVFSPDACAPSWFYVESIDDFQVPEWNDLKLCEGDVFRIFTGFFADSIVWHNGATGSFLNVLGAGTYTYTAYFPCGTLSNSIYVERVAPPVRPFPERITFCEGTEIRLDAKNPGCTHTWNEDNFGPLMTFSEPQEGYVEIQNEYCFRYFDFVLETEDCSCPMNYPSFLTLNGDGQQEQLTFSSACTFAEWELQIYDLQGRRIYHGTDPGMAWPQAGTENRIPTGLYTWLLRYTAQNHGEPIPQVKKGKVMVYR